MYGLVNKAVHDMVVQQFGEETWQAIRLQADVRVEQFVSMESYPDAITYDLVAAASQVLGLDPHVILRAFGEYWTRYTAQEGYGELLKMSGDHLQDFLMNLDNMHARVSLSYPKLRPPSFECSDMTDETLNLHYYSERPGLAPMVVGLLEGLGPLYQVQVQVGQTQDREQGADHDVFAVRIQEAGNSAEN